MAKGPGRLTRDPEAIVKKFLDLIHAAGSLHDVSGPDQIEKLVRFREVRASALNLLSRLTSLDSVYFVELRQAEFTWKKVPDTFRDAIA